MADARARGAATPAEETNLRQYRLEDAARVFLVVHGVGDHSSVDIVGEAERGFAQCRGRHPKVLQAAERVQVTGLGEEEEWLKALCVETSRGDHVVIPLVWSRLRERFLAGLEIEDGLQLKGAWHILRVIPDVAACIRYAGSGWLRLALGALVGVLGLVAALLVAASATLSWHGLPLRLAFDVWLDLNRWWRLGAYVLAAAAIVGLVVALAGIFDLICDVAAFIGRPRHRRRALSRMRCAIERLRARAADAELVVIGHSLGSVLVTHALRGIRSRPSGPPLSVVTLGSPLGVLARLFPSVVTAPAQLAVSLRSSGRLGLWMNFWRDWDLIGRRLPADRRAGLVQQSLGDGSHGNYWRDANLWDMFVRVFDAPTLTLEAVRPRVERVDLYPDESREAKRSRRVHALLVANGVCGALLCGATLGAGRAVPGLELVLDSEVIKALGALWWSMGMAVVVALVAGRPFVFCPAAARDGLETFRYWRRPAILLWLAWLALCGVLLWRIATLLQRLPP